MQGSSFFCLFCVLNLFMRFVIINKKEYSHKVSSLPRKVQTVKRESGENPERLEPPYASKACAKTKVSHWETEKASTRRLKIHM